MNITMCMIMKDVLPIQDMVFSALKSCEFSNFIIGIDSRSTKETYEIVEKYGFSHFDFTFVNFADARNQVLERCKTDWVFFIDSDETITNHRLEQIKLMMNMQNSNAYAIARKHWTTMEMRELVFDMAVKPDYQCRLFNRNYGKYIGAVHEGITISHKILLPQTVWIDHYNFAIRTKEDWERINKVYKELNTK